MRANNVRRGRQFRARDPDIKKGLMLHRRVGEKILVGDQIEITLISTNGPVAEIHVSAPRCIAVDRAERRAGTR